MTRPAAIVRFEGLYLASTLVWLIGTALSWDARRRMIDASPDLAGYPWLVPSGYALVLIVCAGTWWLVARRGSRAGRRMMAAGAVISIVSLAFWILGIPAGQRIWSVDGLLRGFASLLNVAAAGVLFTAGARVWFDGVDREERQT